jgi:lactoylglutathione lyase
MSDSTPTQAPYRLSHTMLRGKDLKASLHFYCDLFGMQVLRNTEYADGRFTNTFIGYGPEASHATIELTHNWDQSETYDKGNGFGHIAIEVDDAYLACEMVKKRGGKVTREAGPMKHGATVIAFVEDPDGYKIEFIQKKIRQE